MEVPLTDKHRRRLVTFARVLSVDFDMVVFEDLWKLNTPEEPTFVTDVYALYVELTKNYFVMLHLNLTEATYYPKACKVLLGKIRAGSVSVGARGVVHCADELLRAMEYASPFETLRSRFVELEAEFSAFRTVLRFIDVTC